MKRIKHALEGVYPSHIYTMSKDGAPIDPFLTQICYVDERHVALSFQFFNHTLLKVQEHSNVIVRVRDPVTLVTWELMLKYVRTENNGPIVKQMASKLATVASLVEMEDLFYLKAADIYEVLNIKCLNPITSVS